MTRINCIDPELLNDKHLIAEYRELPRIFNLIRNANERNESPYDQRNPRQYVLGTGHVRFFYNKAKWLVERQKSLIAECLKRGFNVQYTDTSNLLDNVPPTWQGDWHPTNADKELNIRRINDRGGLRIIKETVMS